MSLDFSAQELRLTAEESQDPAMLSCYVGDNKRDIHSITGASIAKLPYDEFKAIVDDDSHPRYKEMKHCRANGKTVNFAELYGSMAKTIGINLMVPEEEAQRFLDAKAEAFPLVEKWKHKVIEETTDRGYACTMLGARRHLKDLKSSDNWKVLKAQRQAVNFVIQGSGAEMTKLAMGRIWEANIRNRFDIRFFAPVHDELVFSIAVEDIPKVVPEIHAAMTAQYADMAVPVESSVSIGWNFGDQKELGDGIKPTAENLQVLIDKVGPDIQAV